MKLYTIYEIPGVKVGCDYDWPQRAREQGVNHEECVVLQQETDVIQASIDEIWWQIEKDYPVDTVPYFYTAEHNRKMAPKGGYASYEKRSGLHNPDKKSEYCSSGGKVSGNLHKENGTGFFAMSDISKKERNIKGGSIGGLQMKGKLWINDGNNNKRIDPMMLQQYLNQGYSIGQKRKIK